MKKASFWVLIVTLFLLTAPLLANQGHKLRHRQGEIWASCDPGVPVTDVRRAFIEAVVKQYRTGQPCDIKQQKKFLGLFPHAKKLEERPKR